MKALSQEGFLLKSRDVANDILIPRYYDPRIDRELASLNKTHTLVPLEQLVADKRVFHSHGDYVPKIFYGTGPYPYIRTSDLANWEIKASPKHGVPQAVLEDYAPAQDVRPGDILFVHEGTYLIGSVAMVTEFDGPLLYQHHIAKFRVHESCPFNTFYLLAALESPLVHRQVRSKQFSADIIDSVVGRLEEIVIPYPREKKRLNDVQRAVEIAVTQRARLRVQIAQAAVALNGWLSSTRNDKLEKLFSSPPAPAADRETSFLGGRRGFTATTLSSSSVINEILLPKYYDPWVNEIAPSYRDKCDLVTVGDLVATKKLLVTVGDEIGRLNYGTGEIPFVRTSDFGSWELKREAKQGVSPQVHADWHLSQDAQPNDILLVRDGTYLVGTSVLVQQEDLPLLYCGGIFRLRSLDPSFLPPSLLFALLNTPFVRRQMRNKQFTRDVIDTLGQRVAELILPIPKDAGVRKIVAQFFHDSLRTRTQLRFSLQNITRNLYA